MIKLFTILVPMVIWILLTASVFAQSPEKMSYQAVVRNNKDVLVTNTKIGMEINIRQGSQTGTVVYTETQTPTTNANGLVSIEIGGGADFSKINWAGDDYFIETKTAVVAPLTIYTITGVSQLLSVPYALHAKAADNGITKAQANAIIANTFKVGITTAQADAIAVNTAKVGITTAQANAIIANTAKVGITTQQASDITTNNAKVGITTTQTTKLAGIATGAEVNVQADWNQTTTTADDYIRNKPTMPATLTIGQSYQGGIIFWLDATGQHGLIAATADQSEGIQWHNGTYRLTGTTGDGLYAGAMNTAMIVATQMADNQGGNFAAKVCADYSVTVGGVTYGDWYLPSKYELNLLYLQKTAVGGFASGALYWSSTEVNSGYASWQYFNNSVQVNINKEVAGWVRAVRAF